MCGISGIALSEQSSSRVDETILVRMRDILQHRGPDDSGLIIDGSVGLAHRRLTIVDLNTGHQPMSSETGCIHLVFNGEIYNHAKYRDILAQKGHTFRTQSDTEIILHLYEEYGDKCVEHLRGMFAFALWDNKRRRLLLARDRLGIKPLYYYETQNGSLYFGSEIKAILASGIVDPETNVDVLADHLANQSPSGNETLYRGIKRVPAGYTLRWENSVTHLEQYWDAELSPNSQGLGYSDKQYIKEWRNKFQDAVDSHLMADVPLGVLLSGGIDSTAIAAMMSRTLSRRFKSFSVAFSEKGANELRYARLAADAFGTDHHEVIVSPDEYFACLPKLIWHEDEPIAHPASIPLYLVCKLASEHVKVVLTGEGADELMAGYSKYRKTVYNLALGQKYHQIIPHWLRMPIADLVKRMHNTRFGQKLSRTFLSRSPTIDQLYFDNFSVFAEAFLHRAFSPELASKLCNIEPYGHQLALYGNVASLDELNRLLYVDLKIYLQELLMKQDQMSMAASIESRVPFLDRELVDYTAQLPPHLKLRKLTTKYVLRKSMQDIIPTEILNRPKMGFPVPLGTWFRQGYSKLIDHFVLGDRLRERTLFNAEVIECLVEEHRVGYKDHGQKLWSLLNLEIWMRQAIDGDHYDVATQKIKSLIS